MEKFSQILEQYQDKEYSNLFLSNVNKIISKETKISNLKKIFPKKVADAPKIIKTTEKPKVNKIIGVRFIFLFFTNSSKVEPDMYEI